MTCKPPEPPKRWRILGEIEGGTQASLFRVEDATGQVAGTFVLKRALGAEPLARLENEARLLARLDHPGLIRLVARGEDYIVLPYAALGPVAKRRLNKADLFRVARSMALALSHLHAQDIAHRDVSPENILVSEKGDFWLSDFGLALTRFDETGAEITGTRVFAFDVLGLGRSLADLAEKNAIKPPFEALLSRMNCAFSRRIHVMDDVLAELEKITARENL